MNKVEASNIPGEGFNALPFAVHTALQPYTDMTVAVIVSGDQEWFGTQVALNLKEVWMRDYLLAGSSFPREIIQAISPQICDDWCAGGDRTHDPWLRRPIFYR